MTKEIAEQDKHCHICQAETDWILHCHFAQTVHVTIALCDKHRPYLVEVEHSENQGIIEISLDQQKLTEIHYGNKKIYRVILGPEAPGLGIRRPL